MSATETTVSRVGEWVDRHHLDLTRTLRKDTAKKLAGDLGLDAANVPAAISALRLERGIGQGDVRLFDAAPSSTIVETPAMSTTVDTSPNGVTDDVRTLTADLVRAFIRADAEHREAPNLLRAEAWLERLAAMPAPEKTCQPVTISAPATHKPRTPRGRNRAKTASDYAVEALRQLGRPATAAEITEVMRTRGYRATGKTAAANVRAMMGRESERFVSDQINAARTEWSLKEWTR